jgi:hypothetical protein
MISLLSDRSSEVVVVVASLVIRQLDDDVTARLRVQAAEHGRSMEADARAIRVSALIGRRPPKGLGSHRRLYRRPRCGRCEWAASSGSPASDSLGQRFVRAQTSDVVGPM